MRLRWSAPAIAFALAASGSDEPTAPQTFEQQMCIRGTIAVGGTVNGTLGTNDCDIGDSYIESYRLNVAADTTIDVSMTSGVFDTYLFLLRVRADNVDSLDLVASDDDGGGGTDALMAGVTLLAADDYLVVANGFDKSDVGAYVLTIVP
jgi:hypothetical protein